MGLSDSIRDLIISKSEHAVKEIASNMEIGHIDKMTDSFIKTVAFCLENDLIYDKDKDEISKTVADRFRWTFELKTEHPIDNDFLHDVLLSSVCNVIGSTVKSPH